MNEVWSALTAVNWAIAAGWVWRTATALRCLPRIPNLTEDRFLAPLELKAGLPELTVIVPARNEAAAIESTLGSLLAQTIPLRVIAVDDRSSDGTGEIMDRVAARPLPEGKQLTVIHVRELPDGWLGKNHALALAARQATTPWMLFTDGDVQFAPDSLERAVHYAESAGAGHFVMLPTPILHTRGERMMMSFLQVVVVVAASLWRIPDPKAKRESIGVGAFNLIRREVYDGVGGFEALRMEVLEDVRLGYTVKRKGYRQGVAFGPGLARVHWAPGAMGIVSNLTKNAFAVFQFRVPLLLGACVMLTVMCLAPVAGWFGSDSCRLACAVVLAMQLVMYSYYRRFSHFSRWYALTYPVAGMMFVYSLLRSVWTTLWQGGVIWRGTFYPLRELRRNAGPIR
jgi:cellulose synthase/poly-beta-1,6-N-acetylglucosamine synthase-like glycosyltransferase